MGERKKTDWEKIEVDYRSGVKTLRQIAGEHGISHVAIANRAKRDGWVRDLSAKIKAKAESLVTKSAVTSQVTRVAENEVVNANAEIMATVRLTQRKDIQRKKDLVNKLSEELEVISQDEKNLPMRIKGAKDLVDAFKSLIALERQAYGLDEKANDSPPISESLSDAERTALKKLADAIAAVEI